MLRPAIRLAGLLAIAACSRARREEATAHAADASDEPAPSTALEPSLLPSVDAAVDDALGTLIVRTLSEGRKPLAQVDVRVDGTERCTESPCRVTDLTAGTHTVLVSARGESAPVHEVRVLANRTTMDAVVLEPPSASLKVVAPPSFRQTPTAVELRLDGRLVGTLPQCFRGLKAGEHAVSLYEVPIFDRPPGERGRPIYQRELLLTADRTLVLGPTDRPGEWTTTLSIGEPSEFSSCKRQPAPSVFYRIRALRQRCGALARDQTMIRSVNMIVRPRGEVMVTHALVDTPEDKPLMECVEQQVLAWKFGAANDYSAFTFKFKAKEDISSATPAPRNDLEKRHLGLFTTD